MDTLIALKSLHVTALVAVLGGAAGLAAWQLRTRHAGQETVPQRLWLRPSLWAWLVMAMGLAILPFSGWWLVHKLGLALGQGWILASSLLYTFGLVAWTWLLMRLAGAATGRFTRVLAVLAGLCFIGMAVLLVARPG